MKEPGRRAWHPEAKVSTAMWYRNTAGLILTLLLVAAASPAPGQVHRLEAPITAVDATAMTLHVGGVVIGVTPSTEIELASGKNAQLADLKVGSMVEVEGTVTDGKWQASEIEVQRKPLPIIGRKNDHGVEGVVDSIDSAKQTFTVGGVAVKVTAKTKLREDDRGTISFSDLAIGDQVEAEGNFEGDVLQAKKVERDDDDDDDDDEEDDD